MAIQFPDPQVTVTSNSKDVQVKVVKLDSSNFHTTPVNTNLAALPADATILRFEYWNKTKLAGGSISAAALSVGSTSGGTEFVSAFDVFTTVGTQAVLSPVTGIMQPKAVPQGSDIQLWFKGAATTGVPTSGEIYVSIFYVR